jgi:hypothetical protein
MFVKSSVQELVDKGNKYAKTLITDMEIANIVRNKEWFDIVEILETQNGVTKIISKSEALEKYGFKYIGDIVK